MLFFGKIGNHLYDDIFGQPVEVKLDRMLWPIAMPIVVEIDLNRFIELADAVGEQLLNTLIFREGDMRAYVKDKSRVIPERHRMAAIV